MLKHGLGLSAGAGLVDQSVPNKSIIFDGIDERITIADSTAFDQDGGSDTKFSVSLWYKTTDTGNTNQFIAKHDHGVTMEWALGIKGSSTFFVLQKPSGYVYSPANVDVIDGDWHHVVMCYDGSKTSSARVDFYFDGSDMGGIVGTPDVRITGTSQDVAIGSSTSDNNSANFVGNIDGIFYINRYFLSSAEVSTIYNSGSPTDLSSYLSGETRVYWKMGDGDAIEADGIKDSIGSNHGTPVNMEAEDIQGSGP